ncbi:hypothetical protein MRB53_009984 [Persea americana]|uniref:Uncharacterized protein n=1 Tax=Persea americana TaxID=3435 RepID=A0ACC2LRK3_PERAE|nr:hypothetical protein MRB53_009984 [Persea americana]
MPSTIKMGVLSLDSHPNTICFSGVQDLCFHHMACGDSIARIRALGDKLGPALGQEDFNVSARCTFHHQASPLSPLFDLHHLLLFGTLV